MTIKPMKISKELNDKLKEDCTHPDCGNANRLAEGIKILAGVSSKKLQKEEEQKGNV